MYKVNRNINLLARPCSDCTIGDDSIGKALLSFIKEYNKDGVRCLGIGANGIGIYKKALVYLTNVDNPNYHIMYNPVIIETNGRYTTKEGCICLDGQRNTIRYRQIVVQYYDENWQLVTNKFRGETAQVIQHEIDHCNSIII